MIWNKKKKIRIILSLLLLLLLTVQSVLAAEEAENDQKGMEESTVDMSDLRICLSGINRIQIDGREYRNGDRISISDVCSEAVVITRRQGLYI